MKKIIKIVLLIPLILVGLFLLVYARLSLIRNNDIRLQNKYMTQQLIYDANYQPVDESEFLNFDLEDISIKLNDIQMLASHNSYKKRGSSIGKLFIGLGDSFDEAKALKYEYQTLTYQLEHGIRSMELDLRLRRNHFELTHVPIVDNSSTAPRFSFALEEIKLFSDHNPNHLPILILMEIKDDWMMLDPFLQPIGSEELLDLDDLIRDKMGDTLFSPNDMLETGKTLKETVLTTGWPSVSSLRGKVMFIIHPGSSTVPYYELDETLKAQSMFLGVYATQIERPYASFVVHNDPQIEVISNLVNQNYIVRTRIDANLIYDEQNYNDAIASGAQILSSDFLIARKDLAEEQRIYLPNNKMIIKRES